MRTTGGKAPYGFVRGSKPRSRSQIEEAIENRDGEWLSKNLSERDKLDILHDPSRDSHRRDISGTLASKLPNTEVMDAIDKMNRWKDGSDERGKRKAGKRFEQG